MKGRILVIAGSDSGGGAGIQADIKTAMALGAYASTAITALTALDTQRLHGVHPVPLPFLRQQIELVMSDIGADVIKTGMLVDAEMVTLVAELLGTAGLPVVVDPVVRTAAGAVLTDPKALTMITRVLLPVTTVLTPNLPEAEALAGMAIPDVAAMHRAADILLTLGVPAVLLKGGRMPGATVTDLLATLDGVTVFERPRLNGRPIAGTGGTLAMAVAVGLAQQMALPDAVERARNYVQAAIAAAPGFGTGHRPMNHAVRV